MIDVEHAKDGYHQRLLAMAGREMLVDEVNFLMDVFSHQVKTISNLQKKVEALTEDAQRRDFDNFVKKRPLAEQRYLLRESIDSSSSKITINPCDGRVSLKISKGASEKMQDKMVELAEQVIKFDRFYPMTYRGRIGYNVHTDSLYVVLTTESKQFKVEGFKFEVKC